MTRNLPDELKGLFKSFTLKQKIVIGAVTTITIILFIILFSVINQPTYSVLYSNLAPEDASKVVDVLTTQKVSYKLEDNGSTIKVPKDDVYKLRLSLASHGVPSSGVVGYEIFDKSTMGMSEFLQKISYKRALEGELARTIMQQDGIEGARVLIVIPEKSVFRNEEKQPTASVVLKLRSGYHLSKSNIAAILNLVSNSVEGLAPNNVTLLDTRGQLLSRGGENNHLSGFSSEQYEIKQSVEGYLAGKAQSMLDNVIGQGNSMVQVNAELNFNQVEKTMHTYDPESQVAISEQVVKSESINNTVSDSAGQLSENNIINYEISKTIQRVVEETGNITKISVAVVVNDLKKEIVNGGITETVFEPRSPEQLHKLEQIIKNAVGINPERGDQFSIVNLSFETKPIDEFEIVSSNFMDDAGRWVNIILLIGAGIGIFLLLKGFLIKLQPQGFAGQNDINSPQTSVMNPGVVNQHQGLLNRSKKNGAGLVFDQTVTPSQNERINEYITKNPADAAKVISAWLNEEKLN